MPWVKRVVKLVDFKDKKYVIPTNFCSLEIIEIIEAEAAIT